MRISNPLKDKSYLAKAYDIRLRTYHSELIGRERQGLPIEPSFEESIAFFDDLLSRSRKTKTPCEIIHVNFDGTA